MQVVDGPNADDSVAGTGGSVVIHCFVRIIGAFDIIKVFVMVGALSVSL